MSSTPLFGVLGEFDPSTELFAAYSERLEQYFIANSIGQCPADATQEVLAAADKKKVAVFISVIGKKSYATLRDLCSPDSPKDKSFSELCEMLRTHYKPKRLVVAETYRFHRCIQEENVSDYSARLRHYASTCDFGQFLNRSLRDQFICGIRNSATRKKLLNEDRTFQDVLKVAIADEVASKETLAFQNNTKSVNESVHTVGRNQIPDKFSNSRNTSNSNNLRPPLPTAQKFSYACYSCGGTEHSRAQCRFRNVVCSRCKRTGHIARVCKRSNMQNNFVEQKLSSDDVFLEEELFTVFDVNSLYKSEIFVPLKIENQECSLQLDTGCALSLAPQTFYEQFCSHILLKPTAVRLSTYTGEKTQSLGQINVNVTYAGTQHSLPLLLHAPRFLKIRIHWTHSYDELFQPQLGCYTGDAVVLNESKGAKFHKARPVPYAIQTRVESALLKMEKDGVIERISSAVSAAPIVTVGKKDGDEVRVCGDFSVIYNACAEVETYPMPKIEDMHSALRGCQVFSVLDLKQAYHQIPISTESQKYLTINTHLGLFAFKRLPNGIHSGPAIFQRIMDGLLADIPKAVSRLDDILIAGTDYDDHLNNLSQVLERLLKFGLKLNKSKCKFLQSSVVYLGHLIDSAGLHPTEDKLAAKNVPWKWTKSEDAAFKAAKNLLLNSRTLVHYNESLPLVLSCDASSYGAGAALSHVINGEHQPIAFASCTLTEAQRNYSQLEKEAFSIIFGLKRFHQYLCGNSFTILTDHRPLLTLLGPHCSVPAHTASRLQRWALILASYHYKIEYRSTTAHADADSIENVECYFFEAGVVTNVTAEMIKKKTQVDPVLSLVYRYIQSGWPSVVDADMIPYKNRSDQLTIHQGCILWGARVVVPPSLRSEMLTELHDTHLGMTRMKGLARSYVWWPKIDSDIEQTVSTCPVCQKMRSEPAKAPVHLWTFPSQPWSRIHIDFAGPIAGKMYLVVVDAYSKFPEVVKMTTTTATTTINALRDIFSRHGLPEILVSDNGPQFIAGEFQQFCRNNGIMHRTSAAYKPSTNGQAERVVQILKSAIEQARITKQDVNVVIAKSLLVYRNAPHSTTGAAPSVLLMGRRLRTRLDLVFPSVQEHVKQKQYKVLERSANLNVRSFVEGENVLARNYQGKEKWIPGVVTKVLGSRHYMVRVPGYLWKRHVDQLVKYNPQIEPENDWDEVEISPENSNDSVEKNDNQNSVTDNSILYRYQLPYLGYIFSFASGNGNRKRPNLNHYKQVHNPRPYSDFFSLYTNLSPLSETSSNPCVDNSLRIPLLIRHLSCTLERSGPESFGAFRRCHSERETGPAKST
ncbi:Transposon Tf2-9 poly, partial [Paramuricea clavata]